MTPALQQSAAMVVLHVDEAHHNIMSAALLFSALGAVRAGVSSATSWSRSRAPFHFTIAQLPSGDFRLIAEHRTVPKPPAMPPPPHVKAPPGTTTKAGPSKAPSKNPSKATPKVKAMPKAKVAAVATSAKASTWTARASLKRSLHLTSTSSSEPMDCS